MKKKDRIELIGEEIRELDKLLTDRISDMHDVKGYMQARHAYVLYRERLWKIRDEFRKLVDQLKIE